MNRPLVLAEWRLARLALSAAQVLVRNRIYPDAVSRAYYSILHSAKALLQSKDVSAESHAAVKRLFGLHLVKTGDLEAEWASLLAEGLDDRLAADYDSERVVSEQEARAQTQCAAAFLKHARKFLVRQGIKAGELRV